MSTKYFKREFITYEDFAELVPLCSTCGLLLRTSNNMDAFMTYTKRGWKTADWKVFCESGLVSWCCAKHFLELV
jgi:hypothetical protein